MKIRIATKNKNIALTNQIGVAKQPTNTTAARSSEPSFPPESSFSSGPAQTSFRHSFLFCQLASPATKSCRNGFNRKEREPARMERDSGRELGPKVPGEGASPGRRNPR